MISRALSALCLLLAAACGGEGEALRVTDAIYRPPLGGGVMGVAYLTIESSTADTIVAVSSPAASAVELHATVVDGASVSMRPAGEVELPAGIPVHLAPGGQHLMVIEPQSIENGDTFPVTIQLKSGRSITAECAIDRTAGAGG